jgi:hypothetical protein
MLGAASDVAYGRRQQYHDSDEGKDKLDISWSKYIYMVELNCSNMLCVVVQQEIKSVGTKDPWRIQKMMADSGV